MCELFLFARFHRFLFAFVEDFIQLTVREEAFPAKFPFFANFLSFFFFSFINTKQTFPFSLPSRNISPFSHCLLPGALDK
jgi:hypothetical protein